MTDPGRVELRRKWQQALINNNRKGTTRAVDGVVYREGVYGQLGEIDTQTLIVVGDQDTATVPAKSERMHAAIADSELVYIKGAGHSSTIEEPDAVNVAIDRFLSGFSKEDGES